MFSESAIADLNNSGFLKRFLSFVKRYEQFRNVDIYSIISAWVDDCDFCSIRCYLSQTDTDDCTPFTLTDFVRMNETEMAAWHEYCLQLKHLLDEKHSLYEEFESIVSN